MGDVAHTAAELATGTTLDTAVLEAGGVEARRIAHEAVETELGDGYDDTVLQEATERLLNDVLPALGATETYSEAIAAGQHFLELPTAGTYENDTGRLWVKGQYDLPYEEGA